MSWSTPHERYHQSFTYSYGVLTVLSRKGLAYLRPDISGAYKLAADDVLWTPLLDFVDNTHWNYWGVYVTFTLLCLIKNHLIRY